METLTARRTSAFSARLGAVATDASANHTKIVHSMTSELIRTDELAEHDELRFTCTTIEPLTRPTQITTASDTIQPLPASPTVPERARPPLVGAQMAGSIGFRPGATKHPAKPQLFHAAQMDFSTKIIHPQAHGARSPRAAVHMSTPSPTFGAPPNTPGSPEMVRRSTLSPQPPSYTMGSAADRKHDLGSRKESKRLKLQQELAGHVIETGGSPAPAMTSGKLETNMTAAELELAKKMRACEMGSMRTHTLKQIQHPLSPRYHGKGITADGWRHLPHDPTLPLSVETNRPQTVGGSRSAPPTARGQGPEHPTGETLMEFFQAEADAVARMQAKEERIREHQLAARAGLGLSAPAPAGQPPPTPPYSPQLPGSRRSSSGTMTAPAGGTRSAAGQDPAADGSGSPGGVFLTAPAAASTSFHDSDDGGDASLPLMPIIFTRKIDPRPQTVPATITSAKGRYGSGGGDAPMSMVSPRSPRSPRGAYTLQDLFPAPPPPPPIVDIIHPGQYGSNPPSPRKTYHYLTPKSNARSGARRERIKRKEEELKAERGDEDEAPSNLDDRECERQFNATEDLPPYKRVQEKIRLLREQDYVKHKVRERAAELHRLRRASIEIDYVEINKASCTKEAEAQRLAQAEYHRQLNKERTIAAQKYVNEPRTAGLPEEKLQQVRHFARINALKRGFGEFVKYKALILAFRWSQLVRLANMTFLLNRNAKLAKLMKHIKETSQTIQAVKTIQRAWRAKKAAEANKLKIDQLVRIQRRARKYLNNHRVVYYGGAVDKIREFLQASNRHSPLEMALMRYSRRVKIVQKFVKGQMIITSGKMLLLNRQWQRAENHRLMRLYGPKVDPNASAVVDRRLKGEAKKEAERQAHLRRTHGMYAGVPDEMLDTPLPHIPDEMRQKYLKKILAGMRRAYIEESVLWDQKVLLAAEQHPALAHFASQSDQGLLVKKLALIQHEIAKDKRSDLASRQPTSPSKSPSKATAVVSMADNIAKATTTGGSSPSSSPTGARAGGSPKGKNLLRSKTRVLQSGLAVQKAALEEIRASIPRPFVRCLAPIAMLNKELEKAAAECEKYGSFVERPIRKAPPGGMNRSGTTRLSTSGPPSPMKREGTMSGMQAEKA